MKTINQQLTKKYQDTIRKKMDSIEITNNEYKSLLKDSELLSALMDNGVTNLKCYKLAINQLKNSE